MALMRPSRPRINCAPTCRLTSLRNLEIAVSRSAWRRSPAAAWRSADANPATKAPVDRGEASHREDRLAFLLVVRPRRPHEGGRLPYVLPAWRTRGRSRPDALRRRGRPPGPGADRADRAGARGWRPRRAPGALRIPP